MRYCDADVITRPYSVAHKKSLIESKHAGLTAVLSRALIWFWYIKDT